jgi:hypothetical protein
LTVSAEEAKEKMKVLGRILLALLADSGACDQQSKQMTMDHSKSKPLLSLLEIGHLPISQQMTMTLRERSLDLLW